MRWAAVCSETPLHRGQQGARRERLYSEGSQASGHSWEKVGEMHMPIANSKFLQPSSLDSFFNPNAKPITVKMTSVWSGRKCLHMFQRRMPQKDLGLGEQHHVGPIIPKPNFVLWAGSTRIFWHLQLQSELSDKFLLLGITFLYIPLCPTQSTGCNVCIINGE